MLKETNKKVGDFTWSFFVGSLFRYAVEVSVVFLIFAPALLLELYTRELLDSAVIFPAIFEALFLSTGIPFLHRVGKFSVYLLAGKASSLLKNRKKHKKELKHIGNFEFLAFDYAVDIFATVAIIVGFWPVRPVLQNVVYRNGKPFVRSALAKFDAAPSIIILSIIGVPLIIMMIRRLKSWKRVLGIMIVIATIVFVGQFNSLPNYEARVWESRAAWITKDWQKSGDLAQKALLAAQTPREKATSYYWLGVSENRQGNTAAAIEYATKAVEADPTYGAPHSSLALSYAVVMRDAEKGRYHAEKCISLDPEYAWCYYGMSASLEEAGELEEMYRYLRKAQSLDPHSEDIRKTIDAVLEDFPWLATSTKSQL